MDMKGLSTICAGLGTAEEDDDGRRIGYTKGEYCLDNLKDLLRFLRRDDPQAREVFKQVCKWNIVSKDLIPIIEHYQDDRNLVLNAVKILVFLTMLIEPSSNDIPQQIEYLWGLKSSITCSNTIAVIVSLLEGPLENLECDAFTEDDWKLVQLVLTLFRNILAIQDVSLLQKAGVSASLFLSLRDRFLELLFHENVMDLIIVITQHIGGSSGYLRQDNLLLLETFHYIFLGQNPELTAKAHLERSKVGGDTNDSLDSLKSIMKDEEEKRKLARLRNVSRHSQFSGTFTRLTMDGSRAVFKGNPSSASQSSMVRPHKGHGATKKIVWEYGLLPSIRDNILELLHDFVNQFLSGGYSVLMQTIREDIEKEHHAIQNSDIIVFFQVAQFVTSFQYHKFLTSKPAMEMETSEASANQHADITYFKGNVCGPIAASMNESMFLLVISRWRLAFDGLKETNDYKFLSAAGTLMKNMIRMLDLVLKLLPEDSKEPQTARILLYKLFYDQTDQGMTQFLLNLIRTFDTHKQPKSDLADLVEITNVIVHLMENLQARGTLRVSKKSRKGRKKKAPSDRKETETELSADHPTALNETDISNCERTADFSMSKQEAPINMISKGKEYISVSVLVDKPGMPELEMENLRGDNLQQMDNKKLDNMDDDLCCSTDDSSGDEQPAGTDEVDFKVSSFISAFASCSIIQKLCWLLKFYKSNSTRTNHYIICMLRRITDDLELSPMLYQLSLLTTFYGILDEQKSCPCQDYANIVDFLTSLIRKMLKKMRSQPLLFVEILFWKTRKECHYITAEYLLHDLGSLKNESRNWENISGNGDFGSSQAKGWTHRSIADALGEDEADVVISHDLGYQKNGESIMQDSITSISNSEISSEKNPNYEENSLEHESGKVSQRKKRLVLSDDFEIKIKDLYGKFKDDWNCSRLIAESLDPDGKISAAQVSNKLKQLGLGVAPRKRMRYGGGSSSAGPDKHGGGKKIESESTLHDSNDLEGRPSRQPLNTRKRVHPFSKEQEAMIKDLFEQFKDHRRCSHLIANALDADNTLTAAQVSRKLKQLDLCIPRQKSAKADMQLRDEELNDFSIDGAHDSENETLLAFTKRSKSKDSHVLLNKELPEQNIGGKVSDDSDDEILSSVLKKTRKLLPKPKDPHEKLKTIFSEGTIDESTGNGVTKDVTERDRCIPTSRMDVAEIDEDASQEGTSEAEVGRSISGNLPGVSPVYGVDDLPHQQLDDELADSGDDTNSNTVTKSAVSRRKLRMVIDFEDDD